MQLSDIQKLYAYNDWSNERLLHSVEALTEEQYTRPIVSSYPSIRDTVSHIASSEWIWLRRWLGESPASIPESFAAPAFEEARASLRTTAAERKAWLASLTGIDGTVHYRSIKGDSFTMQLEDVLVHCANHSTYHRGQLVTMLRQAGGSVANTDYSAFIRSITV
ncbi:MAG TPA: DinB family protein [Thermoanaerobaculia bacterium]